MSSIEAGKYTYGVENIRVHWGSQGKLTIGKFCSIGINVQVFLGGNHRCEWVTTYPFGHIHKDVFPHHGEGHPATKGDVVIGHDVWIASNVTILSGVTIGSGAVIGFGSVVTKDVPPYTIFAGNPGKVRRTRFSQQDIEFLLDLEWWHKSDDEIKDLIPYLTSSNISGLRERYDIGVIDIVN